MHLAAIQKTTILDYPGKVATLVFTPGCNLRCGYCHNPEFVDPTEVEKLRPDFISDEVFFRFLATRAGLIDGVVICGGEPTIHTDLPDFCRRIKELGFLVKLDTNGSNPDMLEHLFDVNLVDYVAMDIKNPLDRYSELTGRSSDPDRYARSIRLIMERAPDYEFRTTVVGGYHTSEVMGQIGAAIHGAKKHFIQNYRPQKTLNPAFVGRSCTSEELKELCEIMRSHVKTCEIRI